MGKKIKISIAVFILVFTSVLVSKTFADSSSDPGSINDPIVTKSYVDEQIRQLVLSGGGSGGQATNEIATVKLNAGDILVAGSGTEVILRTGKAVAYGDGSNGIPDVTGGVDIKIGSNIPSNHQLIFPKADGRGIKITTGPAYVMVRGSYEIIRGQ